MLMASANLDAVLLNGPARAQVRVRSWPALLKATRVARQHVLQLLRLLGTHGLHILHHDPLNVLRTRWHRNTAVVVVGRARQRVTEAHGQVQVVRCRKRISSHLGQSFVGACEAHVAESGTVATVAEEHAGHDAFPQHVFLVCRLVEDHHLRIVLFPTHSMQTGRSQVNLHGLVPNIVSHHVLHRQCSEVAGDKGRSHVLADLCG
mmetsp:Transcript_88542/g.159638  ORF Transcript_88542/g.159638 Transcript_88542/m.159638 type:complete len:205 (-) Transcript_88542:436-1050(-)